MHWVIRIGDREPTRHRGTDAERSVRHNPRMDVPPEDAYGRVTNAERFELLHEVADWLIADLAERFDVSITAEDPTAWDGPAIVDVQRVIAVIPATSGATGIRIAFGGFPGLAVKTGRWDQHMYPVCGCDACDDDPRQLADELLELVEAVVSGRFLERHTGMWIHGEIRAESGALSSWGSGLPKGDQRRKDGPVEISWAPWTPRAPN